MAVGLCVPMLILTGYGFSIRVGSTYSVQPNNMLKLFVVAVLIGGIIASQIFQALFGSQLPVFLGRISFGVYLVHQPLESTILLAYMGSGIHMDWALSCCWQGSLPCRRLLAGL